MQADEPREEQKIGRFGPAGGGEEVQHGASAQVVGALREALAVEGLERSHYHGVAAW
mgnify:CR=1 FL=1